MRAFSLRFPACLSLLMVSVVVCAQSSQARPGLSLREAMIRALESNPQILAVRGQVDDANGQTIQAALKPNPRLTVQTEDIRPSSNDLQFSFVNSTEDYLIVAQTFEAGGKRARRVDTAQAALKSTEIELDVVRLQIEARVSSAYWLAASAARTFQLQEESLKTFEEDVRYTRNRVNEGVTAEADLIRIELERDRAQAQLLSAKRAASQSLLSLYRAMGTAETNPIELSEPMEPRDTVAIPEVERVMESRPELMAARQAVLQAEENVRLQKANGKTDPEVFAGYKRNAGYDTFYGAVQIDLPVRNRNQGNVLSAQARVRVAQARLNGLQILARAELSAAELAYRDQQSLLDMYPAAAAKAQEAERLARAAYREGGIDLLRLLDVERSRIQVQSDYYRALAEYKQSVVALRVAVGEDLLGGVTP